MTKTEEQAVVIFLKLSDGGFGEYEEREAIFDLEEQIQAIVKRQSIGEYDGHEFGDGWARLYVYGPDARRLADLVLPVTRAFSARAGSYLICRYGGPGEHEEKLSLT